MDFRRMVDAVRHVWAKNQAIQITLEVILQNQEDIRQLAQRKGRIKLRPNPTGLGNAEHHYHFIYDLVVPLFYVFERIPTDCDIVLDAFGPLTAMIKQIYGDRILIDEAIEESCTRPLYGIGPRNLVHFDIDALCEFMYKTNGVSNFGEAKRVILVERRPQDEYYLRQAIVKGAGANRRSIINHEEISQTLADSVSQDFDFACVSLEGQMFHEQVRLFAELKVLIAQHGAALANLLWMPPSSIILEFGYQHNPLFQLLAKVRGHRYYCIDFSQPHITVDNESLRQYLRSNADFSPIFNKIVP